MSAALEPSAQEVVRTRPIPLNGAYLLETTGTSRFWRIVYESYAVGTVTAGSATVRYRHKDYEISAGTMLFFEPGEVHTTSQVRAPGAFEISFIPVSLMPELLGESARRLPHWQVFKTCRADLRDPLANAVEMLRAKADEESVRQQFGLALHRLLRFADETPCDIATRDSTLVRRAKQLMRDAYDAAPCRPVRISVIASELGISGAHLTRCFSREVGMAPYQYVQKLRLWRLLSVLRTGPKEGLHSVVAVASDLGFTDASHLHRSVLREYGVTPTRLARDLNEKWARREERDRTVVLTPPR